MLGTMILWTNALNGVVGDGVVPENASELYDEILETR